MDVCRAAGISDVRLNTRGKIEELAMANSDWDTYKRLLSYGLLVLVWYFRAWVFACSWSRGLLRALVWQPNRRMG